MAAYPDTKLLTIRGREDQGRDNYWNDHGSCQTGLFPPEHRDRRFSNKDLVIGLSLEVIQKAYSQGRSTEGEKTMTFDAEAAGIHPEDESGKVWNLLTGDGPDIKQMSLIPHLNIY